MPRKVVEKPFNSNRWSRARYFGFIRSALRLASRKWPPRAEALKDARRPYVGCNARQKWEYRCCECGDWLPMKEVELHHVEECGSLREYDDLPEFVRRLFCEQDGFRVLCKECHSFMTRCHKTTS